MVLLIPGVGKATAHRFWLAVSAAAEPLKGLDRPEILAVFSKRAKGEWRALADGADIALTARTVCDFIAGMTDRFALEEHDRYFDTLGPNE